MGRRQGALGLTSPWRRVGSGEYDTAGCGPEQVSPPPELELTETAKGKAEKPVKLDGCASYSGPEGLSQCLCDRIEG